LFTSALRSQRCPPASSTNIAFCSAIWSNRNRNRNRILLVFRPAVDQLALRHITAALLAPGKRAAPLLHLLRTGNSAAHALDYLLSNHLDAELPYF
jgi:hypothetical protein